MNDELDRIRRRVLWSMPSGLYVLGSRNGDQRNAMTLNEAMQVSSDPKVIAVGIATNSFTHELVIGGSTFSLNILAREDSAVIRKFVKPVEATSETLNGFAYHERSTGSPILDIAVAYLDCRVINAVPAGNHTLFLGEVVEAAFQRDEQIPVLRMEDTRMKYGG